MVGTAWDLLCLCTCVISAIAGYIRGFVWDSGKWIGMCLGCWVAYHLTGEFEWCHWQLLLGRAGLGTLAWGVWLFAISKLSRLIGGSSLSPIDRALGAFGGIVRGCMLLLATFGVMEVFERCPTEVKEACSYDVFARAWRGAVRLVPAEWWVRGKK